MRFDGRITDPDGQFWFGGATWGTRNLDVSAPYAGAFGESMHVVFDYELVSTSYTSLYSRGIGGVGIQRPARPLHLFDDSAAGMAGDTWFFQAWHRDADPAPTSNFTNAVSVTF